MSFFDVYESALNEAFNSNPIAYLEQLLGDESVIDSIDVIKLLVALESKWKEYRKYDVQFGIIISNAKEGEINNSIFNYDLEDDIKDIIQNGNKNTYIYTIDKSGRLVEKNTHNNINYESISALSFCMNSIAFYLGLNGVDVLVKGHVYKTDNHLDSYKDMIYIKMRSIHEYKELLEEFFLSKVQYDPFKRYFIEKNRYPKNIHHILQKNPKALYSKPEAIFQMDMIDFLHNKCRDVVLKEVHNTSDERYDVWILTDDRKLFVFEIKWLGKSVSPEGSVFDKYNNNERAIEGAYQLKDYVDNSEKYSILGKENRIYCGALVVFDARDTFEEIEYDEVFDDYIQIDLTLHYKILKDKIKASKVYTELKRRAK